MPRMFHRASRLVICSMLLMSCSTMSPEARDQMFGALGGAALGGGIGALLTRGDPKAFLAGAIAGGAVGWATVKLVQYHSERMRSAKDEAKAFGYRPAEGTLVKIRGATVTPDRVEPGNTATFEMEYSVLAPSGTHSVPVEETWQLQKDGEVLSSVPSKKQDRSPGGWNAGADITIPKNAKKGTYVVKNRVEAADGYDERIAVFTVQ